MSARGRDFERPLGELLPLHLGEVEFGGRRGEGEGLRIEMGRGDRDLARQMGGHRHERGRADDFDPLDDRRLHRVRLRDDEALEAPVPAAERDGEDPSHRPHRPIQAQFSHHGPSAQPVELDALFPHEEPHRDREIEGASLLADVGRSEVDRDLAGRKRSPRVLERGENALPSFAHGALRESHDREGGEPRADIHLHLHQIAFDPVERGRGDLCEHGSAPGREGIGSPERRAETERSASGRGGSMVLSEGAVWSGEAQTKLGPACAGSPACRRGREAPGRGPPAPP